MAEKLYLFKISANSDIVDVFLADEVTDIAGSEKVDKDELVDVLLAGRLDCEVLNIFSNVVS